MTFNPNIPQGNQTISSTTNGIQTNFSQSDIAFGIDHIAFSVLTNQGMHKQVTLQAPVAAAGAGTKGIIHTNNGAGITFSGIPIPFFSNSVSDYPLMPDLLNTSGTNFSFAIGNILFKLGTGTFSGATPSTATINYAVMFPTAVLFVGCTGRAAQTGAITLTASTTSLFTASVPNGPGANFYYLAIGY